MNSKVKSKEVFQLKKLVEYEDNNIVKLNLISTEMVNYLLVAFDEGQELSPHKAKGNVILSVLEGSATINYDGVDYRLEEGDCFKFERDVLHSVKANKKLKIALLIVME